MYDRNWKDRSRTNSGFFCFENMDPVVSAFMQRIVWSLTSALVWLMINAVAGLKFELAFFDGNHSVGTILYYCWLVGSIFLLFKLFKRWWKEHL